MTDVTRTDYYCALCGSTFSNYHIAEKPHSARFRQEFRSSQQAFDPARNEGEGPDQRLFSRYNEDDASIDNDEMHAYDPSIISREDAKWVYDLQCLGINSATQAPRKGFVSAIAFQSTNGVIDIHGHDDTDPFALDPFSAYYDTTDPSRIVYPFHPICWGLFQIVLDYQSSGTEPLSVNKSWVPLSETSSNIDKALLFDIMTEHGHNQMRRLTGIDYGDPDPPNQAQWVARPGEELLLADPMQENEDVKAMIADVWCSMTSIHRKPSTYPPPNTQKTDLFSKLPYELLKMIIFELEVSSLINLASASPHVYRAGIENPSFWLNVMRSSMPWFFELQGFLDSFSNGSTVDSGAELDSNRLRLLCLWAYHITTPRIGKTGSFMGVANRRRIWGICRQLIDVYTERVKYWLFRAVIQYHALWYLVPFFFPVEFKKAAFVPRF